MKFYERHDEDLQINLTPLIDVVFLLLIFFMVSTTFKNESRMQIRLPEASEAAVPAEDLRLLEVQISEREEFAVRGPEEDSAQTLINNDQDTIYRALRDKSGDTRPLMVIRADRRTPHEAVVRAMDAARRLGLTRVTFATTDREP